MKHRSAWAHIIRSIGWVFLIGTLLATGTVLAFQEGQKEVGVVVVELFTSEGCSSCPPADTLLNQLHREQPVPGAHIIALGEHVDYWDRLGWKDPFSSPQFSRRQRDFSQAAVTDGVYTPQMIVDGRVGFVGSNREKALQVIEGAARLPKLSLELEVRDTAKTSTLNLSVRVGGFEVVSLNGGALQLLVAVTERNLQTDVALGENAGRHLEHAPVVRTLKSIGTIPHRQDGDFALQRPLKLGKGWNKDALAVVVFVQEKGSRRILGAVSQAL